MSKPQRVIASLLSINALLLVGVLWVLVAERPILAETAFAQQRNFPNAGAQRTQTIAILNQIRTSVAETNTLLQRGPIKVVLVSAESQTRPKGTTRSGARGR